MGGKPTPVIVPAAQQKTLLKENLLPKNGSARVEHVAPDGGTRAWCIMIASFFCNGIMFGVMNTYSAIYDELQKKLDADGVSDASSKAALVGSLSMGITFLLSPISGILTDRIGIRLTTFIGGALAASGMLLASFTSSNVEMLYLTYGVMYGVGASLAYTPSLAVLGHYFDKNLGIVNGVVSSGSSTFTILMPIILDVLLRHFGLEVVFRFLAVLASCMCVCALLFKPINVDGKKQKRSGGFEWRKIVNTSNWRRKRYAIWALTIPFALFGYFVPYVHIQTYVRDTFPDGDRKLPVMCIGITSLLGRLIFGYIADRPNVNRIHLQQLSFFVIGVCTMCLSWITDYWMLVVIALVMGLFDGCFVSLFGPIAFELCGKEGASQAIGFLFGLCSFPLTIGPPIAGFLYDHMHSYSVPFILAGISPILGACIMFAIDFVKDDSYATEAGNVDDNLNGLDEFSRLNGNGRVDEFSSDIVEKGSRS